MSDSGAEHQHSEGSEQVDPHEWEQYEDRYRQRPETYDAYVDVWNRVSRARSLFGGWSLFSRTASAEPLLQRTQPERVREAEAIMRDAGYEIGEPTSRGARRWSRGGGSCSPPQTDASPPSVQPERFVPIEDTAALPRTAPSPEPHHPEVPQSPLVEGLLRSEIYTARCADLPRVRTDDQRVAAALNLLMARGGVATTTAIASACGLSTARIRGFLAVLARILNIDGYTVLSVEDDGDEVRINHELLRSQFHLDT